MRNIVIIGRGQLGQMFAQAALRCGVQVTPFLRNSQWSSEKKFIDLPENTAIFCTVSENSIDEVIQKIPQKRRDDLIFVQNNFFPKTLLRFNITTENIALVWFAKKAGKLINIAQKSLVYGKHANLFQELLLSLDVPCETLESQNDLYQAILDKYAFILTINSLGIIKNLTLGDWLEKDIIQVKAFINESAKLGSYHLKNMDTGEYFNFSKPTCETNVIAAMQAMSSYFAKGRTAEERIKTAKHEILNAGLNLNLLLSLNLK